MKKKLISAAFVVAIALTAGYNVYNLQNKIALSDLALDNMEALANEESGGAVIACGRYEGRCWNIDYISPILFMHCKFTGDQSHLCYEG